MPRTGRPRTPVKLEEAQRDFLQRLVARRTAPAREVLHARIILISSEGLNNKEVAKGLSTGEHTVSYWRRRFARLGVEGLSEMPRPGAPRRISDEQVEKVIRTTLEETPKEATHWSTRSLAARLGLSPQAIHRIWRAFGLQPHRQEVFTLSKDPFFIDKVRDVVGLYMNPPQNALVLSVDEKSQIQALERSQPLLPMRPGRPQRWSHDYYRHGTTSLFAALEVATGRIIGATKSPHRSQEFLSFLRQIEREVASPCRGSPHPGQLRDAQDCSSGPLAQEPTSLASALRSHALQLAKSGRALLCSDNQPPSSSWLFSKRRRFAPSHRGLPRSS
jgi:transposase